MYCLPSIFPGKIFKHFSKFQCLQFTFDGNSHKHFIISFLVVNLILKWKWNYKVHQMNSHCDRYAMGFVFVLLYRFSTCECERPSEFLLESKCCTRFFFSCWNNILSFAQNTNKNGFFATSSHSHSIFTWEIHSLTFNKLNNLNCLQCTLFFLFFWFHNSKDVETLFWRRLKQNDSFILHLSKFKIQYSSSEL